MGGRRDVEKVVRGKQNRRRETRKREKNKKGSGKNKYIINGSKQASDDR